MDRTPDVTLESVVNKNEIIKGIITNNVGNNYKCTDKKNFSLGLKITHSPVFRPISVIYSKGDLVYRQYCLLPAPKHILKIIISHFPGATRVPYYKFIPVTCSLVRNSLFSTNTFIYLHLK